MLFLQIHIVNLNPRVWVVLSSIALSSICCFQNRGQAPFTQKILTQPSVFLRVAQDSWQQYTEFKMICIPDRTSETGPEQPAVGLEEKQETWKGRHEFGVMAGRGKKVMSELEVRRTT